LNRGGLLAENGSARAAGTAASHRPLRVRGSARGGLHDGVDDVATDLAAHILAYANREPVVEAGPNAGVRYLLIIGPNVGPAMGDARRGRAGHADFGNLGGTQRGLDGRCNGTADDAVRARIFGMHRRVVDRLPVRIAFSRRVVI